MLDKLKVKGYHTSANTVSGGDTALTGDQFYSNPVHSISVENSSELNTIPSISNLLDLVKELNGVGENHNNYLSETFSDKVASAFAEFEANAEIASNPEFDLPIKTYGGSSGDSLNVGFWNVARHMKTRGFRKVNRDIYFVTQRGYDLHASNTLGDLFGSGSRGADENERGGKANENLQRFIQHLKDEGLWDSTAILMASDFGRSLNPNSGGGTDHGWVSHLLVCLHVYDDDIIDNLFLFLLSNNFRVAITFSLEAKLMGRRYLENFPLHSVRSIVTGLVEEGLSLRLRGMQVSLQCCCVRIKGQRGNHSS